MSLGITATIIRTNPHPITRFVLRWDNVERGSLHVVISTLRIKTLKIKTVSIKRLMNSAVKQVEWLNGVSRSSCVGFVDVD
jgi:hypothetical protein